MEFTFSSQQDIRCNSVLRSISVTVTTVIEHTWISLKERMLENSIYNSEEVRGGKSGNFGSP